MACAEMKYSHEHRRLRVFISIAMDPAICSYDEQASNDIGEESEKTLSLRNCCGLFQVKAWLKKANSMAASDPSEATHNMP